MRVTYEMNVCCQCPVNGLMDSYATKFISARLVQVEWILEAVKRATVKPAYQEHLTQELANQIGLQVETTGWHSGVKTTCVCEPAE